MITPINSHIPRPFNSPFECGLRMLFILAATSKQSADLQRLASYDYLLVHSGDVDGGPPSLHPDVPFRGNELLVKRDLIEAGLNQMFARELLKKAFTNDGIIYASNELTTAFISLLTTDYSNAIRERSFWVINKFEHFSNAELSNYMSINVGRWGTEFPRFTAARELEL